MPKNDSVSGSESPKSGKKAASGKETQLCRSDEPKPHGSGAMSVVEDFTESEGTEKKRSETERVLHAILDNVPAGISYLNTKEQFQFANQRYKFLLGIKSDILIGTTLEQAIGKKPYNVAGKFAKRALKGETVSHDNVLRPSAGGEISGNPFQSFVTTKPTGMGLGLSICRSIIENHAGKIWAEDNPKGGMSFHFTLPISIEEGSGDG